MSLAIRLIGFSVLLLVALLASCHNQALAAPLASQGVAEEGARHGPE
jgi:hypothetical protein